MKFGSRILTALLILHLCSCSDNYHTVYCGSVQPSLDHTQNDTIIKDPESGIIFSRLRGANTFGLMHKYHIPSNIAEKEMLIIYSGRARTNYGHSNAIINISINAYNGKTEAYIPKQLKYFFEDIDKWCYFRDSITIKWESWQNRYEWISVFASLGNSTAEKFDVEKINVEVKVKR